MVALIAFVALCAPVGAETSGSGDATAPAFGLDKANAVEVCRPAGERAYLSRLICPDGSRPTFERAGSVGERNAFPANLSQAEFDEIAVALMTGRELKPGEVDYHTIDLYQVQCDEEGTAIYLDMYHCHSAPPAQAPAGFQISPADSDVAD